jgi:hypothetical protein
MEICSKAKTSMGARQWKNAEDSLFSLGKGNMESVDSIGRYHHIRADNEKSQFFLFPVSYNGISVNGTGIETNQFQIVISIILNS